MVWLQQRSHSRATPRRVRDLAAPPCLRAQEPDRVRALVGAFPGNQLRFTMRAAPAMSFWPMRVSLSTRSIRHLAARLIQPLGHVGARHDPARQPLMRISFERILANPDLSKNTLRDVSKSLA